MRGEGNDARAYKRWMPGTALLALLLGAGVGPTGASAQAPGGASAQPVGRTPEAHASAMDLTGRTQFYTALHLGYTGTVAVPDEFDGSVGLGFGLGVVLGVDFAASDYFAIGPRLGFGAWKIDFPGADRQFDLDTGISLRPRVPIFLGSIYMELSVAFVAGFTSSFVDESLFDEREFAPGFHAGILPGIRVFFTEQVGVLAELGFMHHSVWPEDPIEDRFRYSRNQAVFNAGLVLTF